MVITMGKNKVIALLKGMVEETAARNWMTTDLEIQARDFGVTKDQRAINALREFPDLIYLLIETRTSGKISMTWIQVQTMIAMGLMCKDDSGYFLSKIAEDVVDKALERKVK